MSAVRVLVVDDDPMVVTGLRLLLDGVAGIEIVGDAADGVDVPARVAELAPDVVLMDIRMPRVDGITATAALSRSGPRPRVLILTTFDDREHLHDALRAGAAGFLVKRNAPQDLVHAIRTVHAGDSLVLPALVRTVLDATAPRADPGRYAARLARLTGREREVLGHLATGAPNGEIAARLHLSPETVKTHVSRVLAKLEVRDRTQAVVLAYESGFLGPRPG